MEGGYDAIDEELAKLGATRDSTSRAAQTDQRGETNAEIEKLQQAVLDLKITNAGKDQFIKQLRGKRAELFQEHRALVDRVAESSRLVGQLEENLQRLEAPRELGD